MTLKVLIADSDKWASERLNGVLRENGCEGVLLRGQALLDAARTQPFDIVFIDLAAPDIDAFGLVEILTATGDGPPMIAHCRVSRKADLVYAIRHGFTDWLEKPAEAKDIVAAVERAQRKPVERTGTESRGSRLRTILQDIVTMTRNGTVALPKMPGIVEEARLQLNAIEVDPAKIARVIRKDPGLAGQVIALANSAALGGRHSVNNIESAVMRLGTRRLASLVETAALANLFPAPKPPLRDRFQELWRTCLATATMARTIAEQINLCDPDEAYLLALFHNVGELFLFGVFERMLEEQPEISVADSFEVMRGCHSQFGAAIIAKWNMAPSFTKVARHRHEKVYNHGDDLDCRLHLVNLAERIVLGQMSNPYPDLPAGPTEIESVEFLDIGADIHRTLIGAVARFEAELATSGG